MKKIYILAFLLFLFCFSCKDNPVNPDKPDAEPHLDSLSPNVFQFFTTIRIYGKNFTDIKTNYDLYLEDFKVDTSRITKWKNDTIEFYLSYKDQITKFDGKLFLKLKSYKSNELSYTFIKEPWISNLYPSDAYFGDTVTITGKNFGPLTDSSKIILNSISTKTIKPLSWSNEKIQFINPFEAITSDLSVGIEIWIGNSRVTNMYDFYIYNSIVLSKLTSLSRTVSSANSIITLTGENFGTSKEFLKLMLGSLEISSFKLISKTQIDLTIPDNAKTGKLVLLRRGRASNSLDLKIINNPFITGLDKNLGMPGDLVQINGNYFGEIQNNTKVFFEDKTAEITSFSNSQITVKVPDIINCSEVRVEVEGVKSNEVLFKTPDCISINGDFAYKVISLEEYSNGGFSKGFVDTLKLVKTGTERYQCSHLFEGMPQPMTVTIYFDNSTLRFNKIYVSDGYQYVDWSPIQATSRLGALTRIYANVSLFSKNNDSLTYICDFNQGIENSFYEQVTWQNFKYNSSGSYTNSGNNPIDKMPTYKISLRKQ